MSSKKTEKSVEKTGLILIDEALSLIRNTMDTGFHHYLMGTLPFLLGGVFFCMTMLRSSFAARNAVAFSLGMSLLYVWMKTFHSIYCQHLLSSLQGVASPPLSVGRFLSTARKQFLLQASGLYLLPVALLIAVPFGWVYAFYQHSTVYLGQANASSSSLIRQSIDRAKQWPKQNHMLLFFLSLFGSVIYLGVLVLLLYLPFLLKRLTGIQTVFTRASPLQAIMFILDPTFHTVALSMTYLLVDPVVKAGYVLRTFYGESIRTGEDLKTELRFFTSTTGRQVTASVLGLITLLPSITGGIATAQNGPDTPVRTNQTVTVSSEDLDRSIERELSSFQYDWRLPRQQTNETEQGWLSRFLNRIGEYIESAWDSFVSFLEDLFGEPEPESSEPSESGSWGGADLSMLIWIALAGLVGGFGVYLLLSNWNRSEENVDEPSSPQPEPDVDLDEEEVDPESMPTNRWEERAQELVEQQEYRKAIRALFLASLSCLASNKLIDIKKYKSNTSYRREFARRSEPEEERLLAFQHNVQQFERLWYGHGNATSRQFESFQKRHQQIITGLDRHES